MADRITQVHQSLNVLASQFCDCIGILHREHEKYKTQKNPADEMRISSEIAASVQFHVDALGVSAANIDMLLDSLPLVTGFSEEQFSALANQQVVDEASATALREALVKGERRLADIKAALVMISQVHYGIESKDVS